MKSKVVIISLKGEERKQKTISRQLDAQGVDHQFFDAIDHRNKDVTELLSPEELYAYRTRFDHKRVHRDPNGAQLGIHQSFLCVLEQLLSSGLESLVICEDDAVFSPAFSEVVTGIEELDENIDLVSLGTMYIYDVGWHAMPDPLAFFSESSIDLPLERKLFVCATMSIGAQGVFVRRSWAEKNLDGLRKFLMPLDVRLFDARSAISPFWCLNMGGDLVMQAVGGGSTTHRLNMGKSIESLPIPWWRQLFPEWFAELWRTLRVMRLRLGLNRGSDPGSSI